MSAQPIDLTTPKKSKTENNGLSFGTRVTPTMKIASPAPAPMASTLTSPFPTKKSFANLNAVGQPVLDLHSALNGIQKSFTIGKPGKPGKPSKS